jgi:hypothetical protein
MRFSYPRFRMSAVLFQYHEEHQNRIRGQVRSCRGGPLSCARSFTDSPHHFDSADYKKKGLSWCITQKIHRHVKRFSFYAFSIHAAIHRNATPEYNESRLCGAMVEWWLAGKNWRTRRKTCSSVTSTITNLLWNKLTHNLIVLQVQELTLPLWSSLTIIPEYWCH